MTVKAIKYLPISNTGAMQLLVSKDGHYFVVSSVDAPYTGPETLVFRSDADGEITDYADVAGGRGFSREGAIADLDQLDPDDAE